LLVSVNLCDSSVSALQLRSTSASNSNSSDAAAEKPFSLAKPRTDNLVRTLVHDGLGASKHDLGLHLVPQNDFAKDDGYITNQGSPFVLGKIISRFFE